MSSYLKKHRHTSGSVETFCELLIRKKLVQIEIKIAQFSKSVELKKHGKGSKK